MLIPEDEARHVVSGPYPGETASGFGTVDVVALAVDPSMLLQRCRSVMAEVVSRQVGEWPSDCAWREILPNWFVEACVDFSQVEEEAWLRWWRGLSANEQVVAERERPWSLPDWLHWLEPDERHWFWWDAVIEEGALRVVVQVFGDPVPLGALIWLLTAGGAEAVLYEE